MTVIDRADSHPVDDIQPRFAVGSTSPQATNEATSIGVSPADLLDPDQFTADTHVAGVGVDSLAVDHRRSEPQQTSDGGDQSQSPVQGRHEIQAGADGWLELRIWSEQLDDAMQARIAATNRAERGGVDPTVYAVYLEALEAAESVCLLALKRCYRRVVPGEVVAWQKSERGIGEKLTARLLGHLGDPCIAIPHHWEGTGTNRVLVADAPFVRTVAQLWQYCGVGDPTRRKRKGMSVDEAFALGNPTLKMLLHLHAECCVKAGSGTYRDVYDDARETYADRTHATECVRCGPSGKPAAEGTSWSKGHQHAAALRKVAKEILRDLWRVRHAVLCPPISPPPTSMRSASAGILETAVAS